MILSMVLGVRARGLGSVGVAGIHLALAELGLEREGAFGDVAVAGLQAARDGRLTAGAVTHLDRASLEALLRLDEHDGLTLDVHERRGRYHHGYLYGIDGEEAGDELAGPERSVGVRDDGASDGRPRLLPHDGADVRDRPTRAGLARPGVDDD